MVNDYKSTYLGSSIGGARYGLGEYSGEKVGLVQGFWSTLNRIKV